MGALRSDGVVRGADAAPRQRVRHEGVQVGRAAREPRAAERRAARPREHRGFWPRRDAEQAVSDQSMYESLLPIHR